MSKKHTPPASASAPAPQPVDTASPGTPEDMAAALAETPAPAAFPDAPVVQTPVESAPAAALAKTVHDDEEARLAARIAELGDPHAVVVAAASRLTRAREEQFETSISLEQAVNLAMDNLRKVQAQAQIDKEEIRLCKLRLEQIASARDADDKAAAATAAHKAKST